MHEPGTGKGDAVRARFAMMSGEIFTILNADLSITPELLPKFVECLNTRNPEFVHGSRLVYRMQEGAMRFFNLLRNGFFGVLFTFSFVQPVTDTLCGAKALTRENYERIATNRVKFGDFDLLFGAASLNLKIRDQPVHFKARTYGETNISRFRHGLLLLGMSWVAARIIKFI